MKMTLKAARVNKGITQKDAAELIGVSKEQLGNWERGVSYPNVAHIPKIELTYGVGYYDIIFLPSTYD